jgi:preprotein translocase SecE subunit
MALKLYKPGQGYWARLMTGVFAGVLVLTGVMWLWEQLSTIDSQYVLYIQAGSAVLVIALFGLLVYRWVGTKPQTCDFLIATEGEMRKVNWPTRREVVGSTWVVVCTTMIFLAILFFSDYLFAVIFRSIGVLET